MGKVLVVLCIDTEGPCFDPNYHTPAELLGTWKEIDSIFLSKIFSKDFRFAFPDSHGQPLVLTWFILNWVGFRTNPVMRDFGYHKIFDHYRKVWGKEMKRYNDEIGWHYHHPPLSGVGNEWETNWFSNRQYEEMLCRMLIDRNFFPISYRAGGSIEDNIQSLWLEQWIPFDYSNRSTFDFNWEKKEADGRRVKDLVNWSQAPDDWSTYHPSTKQFTGPGEMRRIIARCLDIKTKVYNLKRGEVEKAFLRAKEGKDTILSAFEHDFRDRTDILFETMGSIFQIAKKTKVKFLYRSATQAMRLLNHYPLKNDFKLTIKKTKKKLIVHSNKPLFNPQPFLAIKYSKNLYCWLPMFKTNNLTWEYHFLPEDKGKKMAVAAHDLEGNTFSKRFV